MSCFIEKPSLRETQWCCLSVRARTAGGALLVDGGLSLSKLPKVALQARVLRSVQPGTIMQAWSGSTAAAAGHDSLPDREHHPAGGAVGRCDAVSIQRYDAPGDGPPSSVQTPQSQTGRRHVVDPMASGLAE